MGGYNGDVGTTTEILDLSSLEWRRGPALPSRVLYGLSTVYQDTLYLVNDDYRDTEGEVMSLSGDSTDQWKVIGKVGKIAGRQVFPPPVVSQDIIGC